MRRLMAPEQARVASLQGWWRHVCLPAAGRGAAWFDVSPTRITWPHLHSHTATAPPQKRMRLAQLPPVLCLHLKRFKYIECMGRWVQLLVWPCQAVHGAATSGVLPAAACCGDPDPPGKPALPTRSPS